MLCVRRLASTAALHHKRQQLRLCFARWRRWCREEASRRAIAHEAESRKDKMSTLLQAVRRKGEKQPHPQQPAPPILPSNPMQKHTAPDMNLITSKIVRQELVSCYSQCVEILAYTQGMVSCYSQSLCKHTPMFICPGGWTAWTVYSANGISWCICKHSRSFLLGLFASHTSVFTDALPRTFTRWCVYSGTLVYSVQCTTY